MATDLIGQANCSAVLSGAIVIVAIDNNPNTTSAPSQSLSSRPIFWPGIDWFMRLSCRR